MHTNGAVSQNRGGDEVVHSVTLRLAVGMVVAI